LGVFELEKLPFKYAHGQFIFPSPPHLVSASSKLSALTRIPGDLDNYIPEDFAYVPSATVPPHDSDILLPVD